jgi:hypothetical protein
MSRSARARLICSAAAALLAGALGGACGNSPPTDRNFGTNLGADFQAPITDASLGDTNVTPEASVDGAGTAGSGGAGGTAGTGGGAGDMTGASGGAGAAGTGGTSGPGGAGGNAGAAGAGS